MTETTIERWAKLLTDYCLMVQPGETILIGAELEARPLVEACYRAVVSRGAHPVVRVELPGLAEYFVSHASDEQLGHCPPIALYEAELCDGRIRIAAEADPRSMSRVDPTRQAMVERVRHPIKKAASQKRWVLTQYPTAGYASEAEMDLAAYEAYVKRSMFLDQEDPVRAWQELGRKQQGMVEFLSGVKVLRILGEGTDLEISVEGRRWINSDGRRNMPSGEVFTGPRETSAEGRLRCSFPVCRGGRRVTGIELRFVGGEVVDASAQEGEDYLESMLAIDSGAKRLGEVGIGLNRGIDRFTGSILYDEKIGGTVHLALGQSYPETGGTNESALHWDLIVDLRQAGRVLADGVEVMKNGAWSVGG